MTVLSSKIIIKPLSRDQINILRKVEKNTKSFIQEGVEHKHVCVQLRENGLEKRYSCSYATAREFTNFFMVCVLSAII